MASRANAPTCNPALCAIIVYVAESSVYSLYRSHDCLTQFCRTDVAVFLQAQTKCGDDVELFIPI